MAAGDKLIIETVQVDSFFAFTIGIVVFFVGMRANERIGFLRDYNIPEPVTGGILAALVALLLYSFGGIEIEYDLAIRDLLLVYFFTTIGLNARMQDLVSGGKPLAVLLVLTLGYIVVQDIVGVLSAQTIGQPAAMGVLTGSAALIGGHGTAIAWAPDIAADHGISNALEVGVAAATLGLVMASLLGGPIAKLLLARQVTDTAEGDGPVVGIEHKKEDEARITHVNFMAPFWCSMLPSYLGTP